MVTPASPNWPLDLVAVHDVVVHRPTGRLGRQHHSRPGAERAVDRSVVVQAVELDGVPGDTLRTGNSRSEMIGENDATTFYVAIGDVGQDDVVGGGGPGIDSARVVGELDPTGQVVIRDASLHQREGAAIEVYAGAAVVVARHVDDRGMICKRQDSIAGRILNFEADHGDAGCGDRYAVVSGLGKER